VGDEQCLDWQHRRLTRVIGVTDSPWPTAYGGACPSTPIEVHTKMTTTTLGERSIATATWVRAGVIGGIVAGIVFAMFEMIMAAVLNGGDAFFMPLRMIGAIGLGMSALDPASSLVTAGAAGLVIHMVLSMMYGVVTAGALATIRSLSTSTTSIVVVASLAGFALWILNFFVLAGLFGWNWFPDTQNVAVQFVAHTLMFGTVLGIVLDRLAFRAEH
jgi:hypothetical protein